jgi:hypothetical protein
VPLDTRRDEWGETTMPRTQVGRRRTPQRMAESPRAERLPPACRVECTLDRHRMVVALTVAPNTIVSRGPARAFLRDPHGAAAVELGELDVAHGVRLELAARGLEGMMFVIECLASNAVYVAWIAVPAQGERWVQMAGKFQP